MGIGFPILLFLPPHPNSIRIILRRWLATALSPTGPQPPPRVSTNISPGQGQAAQAGAAAGQICVVVEVAQGRPSSGGESVCSAADDGHPEPRARERVAERSLMNRARLLLPFCLNRMDGCRLWPCARFIMPVLGRLSWRAPSNRRCFISTGSSSSMPSKALGRRRATGRTDAPAGTRGSSMSDRGYDRAESVLSAASKTAAENPNGQ
jgi:hypothetical protein